MHSLMQYGMTKNFEKSIHERDIDVEILAGLYNPGLDFQSGVHLMYSVAILTVMVMRAGRHSLAHSIDLTSSWSGSSFSSTLVFT